MCPLPARRSDAVATLIRAAKYRSGKTWPMIDSAIGYTKSTRESWMNGHVAYPSLDGAMRLARYLEIDLDELADAVLSGWVPDWALEALDGES